MRTIQILDKVSGNIVIEIRGDANYAEPVGDDCFWMEQDLWAFRGLPEIVNFLKNDYKIVEVVNGFVKGFGKTQSAYKGWDGVVIPSNYLREVLFF